MGGKFDEGYPMSQIDSLVSQGYQTPGKIQGVAAGRVLLLAYIVAIMDRAIDQSCTTACFIAYALYC